MIHKTISKIRVFIQSHLEKYFLYERCIFYIKGNVDIEYFTWISTVFNITYNKSKQNCWCVRTFLCKRTDDRRAPKSHSSDIAWRRRSPSHRSSSSPGREEDAAVALNTTTLNQNPANSSNSLQTLYVWYMGQKCLKGDEGFDADESPPKLVDNYEQPKYEFVTDRWHCMWNWKMFTRTRFDNRWNR